MHFLGLALYAGDGSTSVEVLCQLGAGVPHASAGL